MKEITRSSAGAVDWRDTVTWYTRETTVSRLVKTLGGLFFNSVTRVECIGLENVPTDGPCIVASNHISNLDVFYMGTNLPRYPHFMAKRELYKNPMFGWLVRQLGSFPVNRGESDLWALKQAGRVLDAGQILFMFPEGTRSGRQAKLKRGKKGMVKLALEHQSTIVPAAIWGTQDFRLGLTRPTRIRLQVGRPLDVAPLAGPPPYKQETLRELTTVVMQQIAAMLPPEHRGVYG